MALLQRSEMRWLALPLLLGLGACASLLGAEFDHPPQQDSTNDASKSDTDLEAGSATTSEGGSWSDSDSPSTDDGGNLMPGSDANPSKPDASSPGTAMIPSNADDFGTFAATSADLTIGDGTTFDTSESCTTNSAFGECKAANVPNAVDACVCRVHSIVTQGTVKITGKRALVLFALDTIDVEGLLSVAAGGTTDGAGAARAITAAATVPYFACGGSFGGPGAGNCAPGYGTDSLVPLLGGMHGQAASTAGGGGGGGGAIQLTAANHIQIGGQGIVAAGGGGGPTTQYLGEGGGSGGGILLEAPTITVLGRLAANGGGGGGGSSDYGGGTFGGGGSDATNDSTPAAGGSGASGYGCSLHGFTSGGSGGAGATSNGAAQGGQAGSSVDGCIGGNVTLFEGGGGGGLGRIRINTAPQAPCTCSGTMSPTTSFGAILSQ